jgi:hypothetical protein
LATPFINEESVFFSTSRVGYKIWRKKMRAGTKPGGGGNEPETLSSQGNNVLEAYANTMLVESIPGGGGGGYARSGQRVWIRERRGDGQYGQELEYKISKDGKWKLFG